MTTSFRIDNNGNIRLPFGRSVEHYLYSLPISQNIRYKGLITVERVEGSVDYLGWKTNKGHSKSTNQLDDILRLTENRRLRVQQIRAGIKSDIHVWRMVWFCSGDGGCQRSCDGFGDCIKECNHYSDQHNFNNPFDMHKYSVRILTEVMLSEIDTEFPVCMTIKGIHVLQNIIRETTALSRINLNREAQDLAIKSHRADKRTTKEIKMKLLAPYNNASQNKLEHLYNSQNSICNDVKLRQLIERDIGRSRSKKEALELGEAYKLFIKSLPLMEITKDSLCNNLYSNWLSEEWINCFINGSRMPSLNDIPGVKPMTTNNLTERINKSVEDNIIEEVSPQFVFKAGQRQLYALLHLVRPVEGGSDTYFYIKKGIVDSDH
ncbi:35277_t:CDS:2, partial [Gigaspora margarita]